MFTILALAALISFVLALFDVHIGSINLVVLGFCFLAAHFLLGGWAPWRRT